jgi:hypothetical protein
MSIGESADPCLVRLSIRADRPMFQRCYMRGGESGSGRIVERKTPLYAPYSRYGAIRPTVQA